MPQRKFLDDEWHNVEPDVIRYTKDRDRVKSC
jgi:hypothetical protein